MTDIVERLREYTNNIRAGSPPEDYLAWQAADEIERLTSEERRIITDTIERCAQVVEQWFQDKGENDSPYVAPLAAAIRALKDKP